jgi:hypothetical protein
MPQLNHAVDSPFRRPFLFSPELADVLKRCRRCGDRMEILVPGGGGRVLPDGTPVIVSGADTVRVWRLAGGTPLVPPLDLVPHQATFARSTMRRSRSS